MWPLHYSDRTDREKRGRGENGEWEQTGTGRKDEMREGKWGWEWGYVYGTIYG